MTDPPAGIDDLLGSLDEARRAEVLALHEAIVRAAPGLDARVARDSIVYGTHRYRYASGREGDWVPVALTPRKGGITLYVSGIEVEPWASRLPAADCGKGCIRLKRAADLDAGVLGEIAAWATRIDGRLLDWSGGGSGEPVIS